MTFVFLGLLALAWMAIFLPAMLRARAEAPLWTAERFKRKMDALAPRGGRWIVMPTPGERLRVAARRRRQRRLQGILIGLLIAVGVTFVTGLLAGGAAWELHLATIGVTATYVVWLRDAKRRRTERARKVRPIARPG
ncbi:MAG: hypothetical protein M3161_02170, partial [Actinomycetota bacterium]|nr:hypothetical protein [Actinomycetota bacterium]